MPKARKKPPSRARYEQEHPTVSVRVSKKLKDVLDTVKEETGNSYAEIISAGLTGAKELWKKGYEVAKRNYEIWYYCAVCGEKIFVSPNSNDHRAMIRYMWEHGWSHSGCH